MPSLDVYHELAIPAPGKVVLLVMDGLGGLPRDSDGLTELEAARSPNMDALIARSICGLHDPVGPGITPGSGPAHLALFGYDPIENQVGRGVLEALGVDFDLQPTDVAARANYATLDGRGLISDRRAGRIPTEANVQLCEILSKIRLPDAEVFIRPGKEHRFVVIFRRQNLSDKISDTDPQATGVPPRSVEALDPVARPTAELVNRFIAEANKLLGGYRPANTVLMRGFAKHPQLPLLGEVYGMRTAAIASYPMYLGLAKLVGMETLSVGPTIADEIEVLRENWDRFDFFFIHVKGTDSSGEDGDFERKMRVIEEMDAQIPAIQDLKPDVLAITGDHSTPAVLKAHSWHPVPVLLYSRYCRPDGVTSFGERACVRGSLGTFPAMNLMPQMMAYALRLTKFGA